MNILWFDLIYFRELPLGERRNLLLIRRQMLFEQHARLEQHQQELEARQMRLEEQQRAFKTQLAKRSQRQEDV